MNYDHLSRVLLIILVTLYIMAVLIVYMAHRNWQLMMLIGLVYFILRAGGSITKIVLKWIREQQ